MWELYYGGWAAPQIYYLGHAGVVNFGGIRIGGMSGTYQSPHYNLVSTYVVFLHNAYELRMRLAR